MTTLPIRLSLPGFALDGFCELTHGIEIQAHSNRATACCPACGQSSDSVHSRYRRKLRDLPLSTQSVHLVLTLRRYRCRNAACTRQTFAEPLSEIAPAFARRTDRLTTILQAVGLTAGGEAGSRLTVDLRIDTSPDTMLRIIRRIERPAVSTPRVLGVDDWAQAKGRRYGTILVDLEAHRPIDLLGDRTAETLAAWLRCHPGIEVIARDRSTEYARGISEGAPGVIEVADRWHLLQNLRQALERLLSRLHGRLKSLPVPFFPESTASATPQKPRRLRTVSESEHIRQQASRARRQEKYQAVQALATEGHSQLEIGRRLGMARGTVRTFLETERFPERAQRQAMPSMLDPFLGYLQQRWEAGCINASQLWREIQVQGYPGTRKQVARWAAHQRTVPAPTTPGKYTQTGVHGGKQGALSESGSEPAQRALQLAAPRQLAWLLLQTPDQLTYEDRCTLERIRQEPQIVAASHLAHQFQDMVGKRMPERFDDWLEQCRESGLPDLQTFAEGLQRDRAAVHGALTEPWSNGQTEGQITRLKLIKRQMYGRGKLDLLRQRVLCAA